MPSALHDLAILDPPVPDGIERDLRGPTDGTAILVAAVDCDGIPGAYPAFGVGFIGGPEMGDALLLIPTDDGFLLTFGHLSSLNRPISEI
jgi:hypothetical protein